MTAQIQPISILQVTDSHIHANPHARLLGIDTAHYFEAVLQQAFLEHGPFDLILHTGDLAQDPVAESYEYLFKTLEAYATPCICLPGNHDDYELMQRIFNAEQVSCRKQVLLKNWQIISLNSQILGAEGGYLEAGELQFLEECLAKHPNNFAMIAVHHHCLPTDSTWMDTMMITNSADFLNVLKKFPQAKVIVNGHVHQIMDSVSDSLRILATPSTCFQFTPKSHDFSVDQCAPGYRVIKLYDNGQIASDIYRLPGKLTELDTRTQGY